jgi:hypothetical protein
MATAKCSLPHSERPGERRCAVAGCAEHLSTRRAPVRFSIRTALVRELDIIVKPVVPTGPKQSLAMDDPSRAVGGWPMASSRL